MNAAEKRWLAQLAAGRSVAQIAKAEKFSVGTMRVYLHNMYKRMGVHNRAQAVAKWAMGLTADEIYRSLRFVPSTPTTKEQRAAVALGIPTGVQLVTIECHAGDEKPARVREWIRRALEDFEAQSDDPKWMHDFTMSFVVKAAS